MGTNYYRIPSEEEMSKRKSVLIKDVKEMPIDPKHVESEFGFLGIWDRENDWDGLLNPWQRFTEGVSIHLGKRSSGWKFVWNFHNNKYYSSKDTLFEFIRSGRVVNEYGELIDNEKFIKIALEWGQPDGHDMESYYKKFPHPRSSWDPRPIKDVYVDGLLLSNSTEFS